MFVDSIFAFSDGEQPLICEELLTNNCSNKQYSCDDQKASKIWVLEKSIAFLKSQHKEMLLALHDEVEHLKQRNIDLQRGLILGSTNDSKLEMKVKKVLNDSTIPPEDVEELRKKICELQEHLKLAQNTNKLLKKELESKRRHYYSKHQLVESSSPVIRKAEQVKTSQEELEKMHKYGDRSVNMLAINSQNIQDVNYSNRSNSICSNQRNSDEIMSEDEGSLQSGHLALPPINADFQQVESRPYEMKPRTGSVGARSLNAAGNSTQLGPIKNIALHRPLPFNDVVCNSNTALNRYPVGGFREIAVIAQSNLPVSSPMNISRSPIGRKIISSHGFPTASIFNASHRMDQRPLLRSTDEMLLRPTSGKMEIQQPPITFNNHTYNRHTPNTSITLPALRQNVDNNQASRRRRNLELQKKRLTQFRHPF